MGLPRRCALVVLTALAFALLPAALAYAATVTCSYAAGLVSVEVSNPAGPPVLVGALPTGEIVAGSTGCGAATVTNTDAVGVQVASGAAGLDLTLPLGPGATPEPGELAEIEVAWSGGDVLVVAGGPGDDDVRVAAAGIHLNGDPDVDVTVTGPLPETHLTGGDGHDVLDASGAPAATAVLLAGGPGDDLLHGHEGADAIDAGDGNDRVVAGAGADQVAGGAGDDVVRAGLSTYSAETAAPVALPDRGSATSTLTIPGTMMEYDVEVRVTLAHTDVSQVNLQVRHRDAVTVAIGGGAPGTAYAGAVFTDAADRDVRDVPGVRTGRFGASSFTMRRLLGNVAYGAEQPWTLSVFDGAADGQAGTLLGWSVHLLARPGWVLDNGPSADAPDTYDGGPGADTLSYAGRSGGVSLVAGTADWGAGGEAGEGDSVRYATFEAYEGGHGTDTLVGSPRDEALRGGYGADFLRGNGGSDAYDCGGSFVGRDTASFSEAPGPLSVDLEAGVVAGDGADTISQCQIVYATDSGDTIVGSSADEDLYALGGDDTITSASGFDKSYGGDGDDLFLEGLNGWGPDLVDGQAGTDRVDYAGTGYRVAVSFNGLADDGVVYPAEHDRVLGMEQAAGGSGDDILDGDAGPNVLDGRGGNDSIAGYDGDDVLSGGDGKDRITAGYGNDVVDGQGGDDFFYEDRAANGTDDVSGGAGTDLVDYGGRPFPLVIGLDDVAGDGEAGEGDNVRSDVEDIWGGALGDRLTGNAAVNRFWGFGGEDVLDGGAGADYLDGGVGNDLILARDTIAELLVGGTGVDVAYADAVDDTKEVEVFSPV